MPIHHEFPPSPRDHWPLQLYQNFHHIDGRYHKFRVEALPDGVRMHYRSSNRLAYFYCALARCLAARRGEVAEISFLDGDVGSAASIIEVRLKPALAA